MSKIIQLIGELVFKARQSVPTAGLLKQDAI